MEANRDKQTSRDGGVSDFIWNLIGGAMIAAMLAGVVYLLVAMVGKYLLFTEQYWELVYLKWDFIVIFAIYLIMPTILANIVGFVFGSKAKSSGKNSAV